LSARLEALLAAVSFTAPLRSFSTTDTAVLLTLAGAVHERHPVEITYTDRHGKQSTRTVHPHGIVGHAGRWYLTATDPKVHEQRMFRLNRIVSACPGQGSFETSPSDDPAEKVLAALARTPWVHQVSVRVQCGLDEMARRLPLGLAVVEPIDESWVRVRLNAERLDWVPALIAGLDHPFVIEAPGELREHMIRFARRLTDGAGGE
jgi:predicted DNA-binding transcriptional regulator YafY